MKQDSKKTTAKVINLLTRKLDIEASDFGNRQLMKSYSNWNIIITLPLKLFIFSPFPTV
jgi:hypothetical protein